MYGYWLSITYILKLSYSSYFIQPSVLNDVLSYSLQSNWYIDFLHTILI